MMLMLLLIVILVYWLVSTPGRTTIAVEDNALYATATPTAMDILKERYVRGEIDRATYLAMRAEVA